WPRARRGARRHALWVLRRGGHVAQSPVPVPRTGRSGEGRRGRGGRGRSLRASTGAGVPMTTTLSDTESAIYTALSALQINVTTGTTAARPFALVGRYAGTLDEDKLREVVTQWPAALLAFGGESVTRTVSTLAGDSEDRGTVR